ncbi:hypothetical protein A4X16_08245 [Microbacterium sp. H83]|nr:hypothetical protein A4X16_08245 [Microbacterium sp. H83]
MRGHIAAARLSRLLRLLARRAMLEAHDREENTMSDPMSYPEDSGPFHPDEVDGVDEGLSELDDESESGAEKGDEDSADAGRAR